MPETVSVMVLPELAGSVFAVTVPPVVERVNPWPSVVVTSMFSLYVRVMLVAEVTAAAVISGGIVSGSAVVPAKVWSSAWFDAVSTTVPSESS